MRLHIYTFSSSVTNLKNTHLCTTAPLRVHKGRHECSQSVGVVVNNHHRECSHGGWRLCTRLIAFVLGRVSCLHEYTEKLAISEWFKTVKRVEIEMQEFLLRDVKKVFSKSPKGGEVWINNLHGANIMIYMEVQSN